VVARWPLYLPVSRRFDETGSRCGSRLLREVVGRRGRRLVVVVQAGPARRWAAVAAEERDAGAIDRPPESCEDAAAWKQPAVLVAVQAAEEFGP